MSLTSWALFACEVGVRLHPGIVACATVNPAGVFLAEEDWGTDVVAWCTRGRKNCLCRGGSGSGSGGSNFNGGDKRCGVYESPGSQHFQGRLEVKCKILSLE